MPGNVFIPFNHQPQLTGVSASGYTCPANKYARCVVTLTAQASGNPAATIPSGNTSTVVVSNDSNAAVIEVWIKAADVIALSTTNPSTSVTVVAPGSIFASAGGTETAIASATFNGTTLGIVRAAGTLHVSINPGVGSYSVGSISGTGTASVYYEEYNVIGA